VEPLDVFHNYQPGRVVDRRLKADLLMELEGEHEPTGRFRWVMSSTEPLVAGFNASDILLAHGAEEFNLTYQAEPAEIMMHTNMTGSGWEDVGDLVAKGRITVTHGEEEASHAFLGMGSSSSSELCSIFVSQKALVVSS
jgi:hypothetical protein